MEEWDKQLLFKQLQKIKDVLDDYSDLNTNTLGRQNFGRREDSEANYKIKKNEIEELLNKREHSVKGVQ